MAHLIALGAPAHEAELAAFKRLQDELPESWLVFTSLPVEITRPIRPRRAKEVDAFIIGERCMCLVELKAHSGTINTFSTKPWELDGRPFTDRFGSPVQSNIPHGFYRSNEDRMYDFKSFLLALTGHKFFIDVKVVFTSDNVNIIPSPSTKGLALHQARFLEWIKKRDKDHRQPPHSLESRRQIVERWTEGNQELYPKWLYQGVVDHSIDDGYSSAVRELVDRAEEVLSARYSDIESLRLPPMCEADVLRSELARERLSAFLIGSLADLHVHGPKGDAGMADTASSKEDGIAVSQPEKSESGSANLTSSGNADSQGEVEDDFVRVNNDELKRILGDQEELRRLQTEYKRRAADIYKSTQELHRLRKFVLSVLGSVGGLRELAIVGMMMTSMLLIIPSLLLPQFAAFLTWLFLGGIIVLSTSLTCVIRYPRGIRSSEAVSEALEIFIPVLLALSMMSVLASVGLRLGLYLNAYLHLGNVLSVLLSIGYLAPVILITGLAYKAICLDRIVRSGRAFLSDDWIRWNAR